MRRETDSPADQRGDQGALLTYAVLTGITPLIPVPFVDDLAKDYFRRRLVRSLAAFRGVTLPAGAVETLTSEPRGCLLGGCLTQALFYPLRKVFRKVFYFLEWKRSLDLTSQTYHFGYLVDCALQDGYLGAPGSASVEAVRRAIEEVCREAPVRPVESAVAATFRRSKSALAATLGAIDRAFRSSPGPPDPARVEETLEAVEEQERREVAGVVETLQGRLESVPEAHFRALRARLRARLGG